MYTKKNIYLADPAAQKTRRTRITAEAVKIQTKGAKRALEFSSDHHRRAATGNSWRAAAVSTTAVYIPFINYIPFLVLKCINILHHPYYIWSRAPKTTLKSHWSSLNYRRLFFGIFFDELLTERASICVSLARDLLKLFLGGKGEGETRRPRFTLHASMCLRAPKKMYIRVYERPLDAHRNCSIHNT